VKKKCVACGKQIPALALDCVFCSARQPAASIDDGEELNPSRTEETMVGFSMAQLAAKASSTAAGPSESLYGEESAPKSPMLGVATREVDAVVATIGAEAAPVEKAPAAASEAKLDEAARQGIVPSQAKLTGMMPALRPEDIAAAQAAAGGEQSSTPAAGAHGANGSATTSAAAHGRPATARDDEPSTEIKIERGPEPQRGEHADAQARAAADVRDRSDVGDGAVAPFPFRRIGRALMGLAGAVLLVLFLLPWHGVSSWQLLQSVGGTDFVLHLFYLTGGVTLLLTAALPLPSGFRALVGAAVAATPVLVGASSVLPGWRGILAAVATLALPATHFCRAQVKSSSLARLLVAVAGGAVLLLYLVPVSSVVPLVAVFKMIVSGEIGTMLFNIFMLIPLAFAVLSLLGLVGRDLTDVGVLVSLLSLFWAPLFVALLGFVRDDATQYYVAVALLFASATAATSLAQLLSLAARPAARA
jgi:hypothetical protein